MPTAYLLIGGNMGNRLDYLQQAQQLISLQCGTVIKESSTYKTAAWGYTEQPDFYNKVLVLQTLLQPAALMQNLLLIEEKMGRKREIKMGPRIIDLDILLMDDIILNTGLLTLPHPALK